MSATDDILGQIDVQSLAQQLGTDPGAVEQGIRDLVPGFVAGMERNAAEPEGAQSLTNALNDHAQSGLGDGPVDLNAIDTDDGEKIASHVFGDSQGDLLQALGGRGGDQSLLRKLIPILAPLVLAYLAKRMNQGQQADAQQERTQQAGPGGILGSILEQMLGGGQQTQQVPQQAPRQQAPQPRQAPAGNDGGLQMPDPVQDDPNGGGRYGGGQSGPSLGDILGSIFGGR